MQTLKKKFTSAMLPHFTRIEPTAIEATVSNIIADNKKKLTKLLKNKTYTWQNLLEPIDNMQQKLHESWAPISHLHAVMETDALRDAYNKTLPQLTSYQTELSQNSLLYEAIRSLSESSEYAQLSPAQQKIIDNELRDFRLAGVHLPDNKKQRFAQLQQALSQLSTTFAQHILDATDAFTLHVKDEKKLAGLPNQAKQLAIDNAKRRNLPGYVFTLDFPSYSTAIRFLQDRKLRKTLYEAYVTRASDQGPFAGKWDNTPVMEAILRTRHELANLVDYPNFAAYSLATKMAKKPEQVLHFLFDLVHKSRAAAKQEYAELVTFAKATDNITDLQAWDIAYYSEKLSESLFQFSQEELRPYFPIDRVLKGLFAIVQTLYGITVVEQNNINVWHPNVRFFAIYDAAQQLQAGFYIDLYARPHKRDGAWMDDCRTRRRNKKGDIHYPVAFLTCNFMPPVGDKPALLTHDEVLTLFHEFGHCLHHMLTRVDYAPVAGINGVPWDAVEFPSQFFENFCWEKEILRLIARHYQTQEPLPDSLYKKMLASKHFQTGLQMMRQLEFSIFDFVLHLEYEPQIANAIQTVLDRVREQVAIITPPKFNRFQHSFSHIFAGGYAAGYYSYKWAEVLSADAYAQFEEQGILNPKTGRSFLKNILEVGGVIDPMQAFVAFRNREPRIDALLRHNGLWQEANTRKTNGP